MDIVFKVIESCATDLAITTVFRKTAISIVSRGITPIFTTPPLPESTLSDTKIEGKYTNKKQRRRGM